MTPADHALWDLWIGAFAARTDAYVLNSRVTVKEPLTAPRCEQAVLDGDSISGYLATRDDKSRIVTTVAAVDVDTNWGDVTAISSHLWEQGISNLTAMSRRGGHIWVWSQDDKYMPVSAATFRRALTNLVALSLPNLIDSLPHIEVFPKAGIGGGALRMPLFKHPKDGYVYPVVSREGKGVTDRQQVYDLISRVDYWTPYKTLQRLAGPAPKAEDYPHVIESQRASYEALRAQATASASALLQTLGVNANPGRSCRCPWHPDKHASLSVLPDDQRVICKAPTCPAHNNGRGIGSLAMKKMLEGGGWERLAGR